MDLKFLSKSPFWWISSLVFLTSLISWAVAEPTDAQKDLTLSQEEKLALDKVCALHYCYTFSFIF
jgi:hypothetical protein